LRRLSGDEKDLDLKMPFLGEWALLGLFNRVDIQQKQEDQHVADKQQRDIERGHVNSCGHETGISELRDSM
jgi:hypothetical protein